VVTLKILKLLDGSVNLKEFHRRLRYLAENAKENGNLARH